jgi:hypothetical protein
MRQLTKLSNNPLQTLLVLTEAGDQVDIELRYMPTQQQWLLSLAWGTQVINGISLVASPNLLLGYANVLPFGIMVTSDTTFEPMFLDDFTSGRIKVYMLSAADVEIAGGAYSS